MLLINAVAGDNLDSYSRKPQSSGSPSLGLSHREADGSGNSSAISEPRSRRRSLACDHGIYRKSTLSSPWGPETGTFLPATCSDTTQLSCLAVSPTYLSNSIYLRGQTPRNWTAHELCHSDGAVDGYLRWRTYKPQPSTFARYGQRAGGSRYRRSACSARRCFVERKHSMGKPL